MKSHLTLGHQRLQRFSDMNSGECPQNRVQSSTYDKMQHEIVRVRRVQGSSKASGTLRGGVAPGIIDPLARRQSSEDFPAVFSHGLTWTLSGNFTRGLAGKCQEHYLLTFAFAMVSQMDRCVLMTKGRLTRNEDRLVTG